MRRWRRELRRLRYNASQYFHLHIWGKWHQLGIIRRLILVWWGLFGLMLAGTALQVHRLGRYYLVPQALRGGRYVEGVVGQVKLINPVLPEGQASADVDKLVFSGLTKFGPKREVQPDLAISWEISADGKTYTFHLRHDVYWHDGVPFKAEDVAFTLGAIQNPDVRSPLAGNWQGVKADTPDDYTVVLTLPAAYPPFINFTTVGMLPRHRFFAVNPAAFRTAQFNLKPVGTGPFQLTANLSDKGEIQLTANPRYFGGRPKLDQFVVRLFGSSQQALEAYAKHQVNAVAKLDSGQEALAGKLANLGLYHYSLPDQTSLFLHLTNPILGDLTVRQALAQATNRAQIITSALNGDARPVSWPLLPGQLGFSYKSHLPAADVAAAAASLDKAGWTLDGKFRAKDGQPLRLKLVTIGGGEMQAVAEQIKAQWAAVGVDLELTFTDAANLQQSFIRPRHFDVLLYGLNLGADPDVYPYWHSTQAKDPGLNLSEYSSAVADRALEAGRVNTDPEVRTGKYQAFAATWTADLPAITLYQPDYIYAVSGDAEGIKAGDLVDPSDRFYNVQDWTIRVALVRR